MNSNKTLKISIFIVLLVALIYGILSLLLSHGNSTNTKFSGFGNMISPTKKSTKSTDKLEVTIDRVLVNVRKGPYKYMKADMSFKMADEKNKEVLLKNMSQARNVIIRFSTNQDSGKLETDTGKQKYKKDLKNALNNNLGVKVDAIYFRNFVLAE